MSILTRLKNIFLRDQSVDILPTAPWRPSNQQELERRLDELMIRYREKSRVEILEPLPYRKPKSTMSYLDGRGYLRFKDSNKLVHRYLVERKLGRSLESWEAVHHIDGNKLNNDPENLLVCSWEDHDAIHRTNMLFYGSWHKPGDA